MATEPTRTAKAVGWIAAIVATLIGLWTWDTYQKYPRLERAGEIDTYSDRTLIPLRTTSSIPVVVNGVYYRICPEPVCCATIDEEEPIQIDADDAELNKWERLNITNFQVEPGKVTSLPIQLFDIQPSETTLDIVVLYGHTEPAKQLFIPDILVNVNRR